MAGCRTYQSTAQAKTLAQARKMRGKVSGRFYLSTTTNSASQTSTAMAIYCLLLMKMRGKVSGRFYQGYRIRARDIFGDYFHFAAARDKQYKIDLIQ